MKTPHILITCTLVGAGILASARQARAITVPDLASTCSTSTGNNGCFKITNNNTLATALTSSAIGTSITAAANSAGTAVKGFNSGAEGSGVLGISTKNGAGTSGNSSTGPGAIGVSTSGVGVAGTSTSGVGVVGSSSSNYGVQATTSKTSSAIGLFATVPGAASANSSAVRGDAQGGSAAGVLGVSGSGIGVNGVADDGIGVWAASSSWTGLVAKTDGAGAIAVFAQPASTSDLAYYGMGGIQLTGSFAEKVGGGAWSAPSDARIKKDVKDLDRGLDELMRVRPVSFKYNGLGGTEDNGKEYVGVIAQELEAVLPSMVGARDGKLHKGDAKDTKIKIVDPSAFTYLLINAVKQQQRTIDKQQAQIAKQDARIADLERRSAPVAASVLPGGSLGGWAALALLPIGLFVGRRRQVRNQRAQ